MWMPKDKSINCSFSNNKRIHEKHFLRNMCSGLKGGAREGSCRLSPGKTITWLSLAGEKAWVVEGICHVRTRRWPRHCSHEGEEMGGSCRISTDKLPRGRGHHSSPELPKFFNFFFWIKGESRALAPTISNDWLEGLVNQRRIVWYCDSWEYECWDFASTKCDYCDIVDNITSHTNMVRVWRDVRFILKFVCAGPCGLFLPAVSTLEYYSSICICSRPHILEDFITRCSLMVSRLCTKWNHFQRKKMNDGW